MLLPTSKLVVSPNLNRNLMEEKSIEKQHAASATNLTAAKELESWKSFDALLVTKAFASF